MATRRRSRFSTLTNTVSDINQRLRYVEKRRSYSRLASQVVNRQNIKPKAVSTDQLANKSVTTEIIDDDAVTSAQIADGTIQSGNIGPGSIQNVNMGGGQVDGRVLADNTIESRHIKDGEVKEGDLGTDAVTTAKINGLAVTTEKINNGAVTTDKINGLAVTTEKINNGAVTTDKINGLAVTTEKINNGAVTTDKIGGLQVTNEKLAEDSVGTGKIRDSNVTNRKLAGGITNDKLAGGITNDKLAGGITNGKLAGGITRDKISPQIISTVSAGGGLNGGGSANSVTLSVDFGSVARQSHTHSQYVTANHTHDDRYPRFGHTHFVSGGSGIGGNPAHTHNIFITSQSASTMRVKEDISSYEFDTSKLLKLDLKKFKYLKGAKPRDVNREWFFGYLAEELVENGIEEAVGYDEEGLPNSINYSLIGVMSLELVKKHEEKIVLLEQEIQRLRERLV